MRNQESFPSREQISPQEPAKFIAGKKDLILNPEWVKKHPEYEQEQEEQQKKKRERFKIPDDVKPGSVDMVRYSIKHAILKQEDLLSEFKYKHKKEPMTNDSFRTIDRREKSIFMLNLEETIFHHIYEKEKLPKNVSADKMLVHLQNFIDKKSDIKKNPYIQIGALELRTDDVLKAADNLKSRLISEANKLGPSQ